MTDLATLEISAEARASLRGAIKAHPGWGAYRAEHDTDMAQMTTKEALVKCCDGLGVDIAAVIAGTYMPEIPATPAAPKAEKAPKAPKARKAKLGSAAAANFVQLGDIAAKLAPAAGAPDKVTEAVGTAVGAYVRDAAAALLSEDAMRQEIDRRLAAIDAGAKAFAARLLADAYAGVIDDLIAKGFRTALVNAARYFPAADQA